MKMDKYRQHFLFSVYTLAPLLHSSMHTLICIIACLLLLLVDGQTPAGRCIYSLSLVTLIVGMWCWPWAENITSDRRLLFKFLSWRSSLNTLWSGWHGKNLSWTPRAVSHLFSDGCREVNSGGGDISSAAFPQWQRSLLRFRSLIGILRRALKGHSDRNYVTETWKCHTSGDGGRWSRPLRIALTTKGIPWHASHVEVIKNRSVVTRI